MKKAKKKYNKKLERTFMNHYKPLYKKPISIFLAGSIEMGKAERWQDKVVNTFQDYTNLDFFNPRRDDWDSSWKQDIIDTNFRNQVEWEVRNLQSADIVFCYIDPTTMSPVTLFEIGMMCQTNKLILCAPKGYWRHGNLQVYSKLFNFPLVETFEAGIELLRQRIERMVF